MKTNLPQGIIDALQFEETILPNGLCIRVLPMPQYHGVHAMFSTKFGSIDRDFTQGGKTTHLPAGVAHFLEHKMFENEDGVDAFTLYAETGASANAYTSFERTSYIFTATEQIERNLDILLSFVGKPYFTEATVQKEQGIIGQELMMYQDNADLQAMYALLESLYHAHPIREEIGGTIESIAEITPEMLYICCDAFYNPSNMVLCAAGNITMQQLLEAVERAGLPKQKAEPTTRHFPQEPQTIARKEHEFEMEIAMPILNLGFKEQPPVGSATKTEVICDLLTELLVGETSRLYHRLYDEGLVQPGFGADYGSFEKSLYFAFSAETEQPERVKEEIYKEIKRQRTEGIDPEQFETCKKMMYGESVFDLENVERVASLLTGTYFKNRTPQEEMEEIAGVTLEDVQKALEIMLQEERSASVVVRPKSR